VPKYKVLGASGQHFGCVVQGLESSLSIRKSRKGISAKGPFVFPIRSRVARAKYSSHCTVDVSDTAEQVECIA